MKNYTKWPQDKSSSCHHSLTIRVILMIFSTIRDRNSSISTSWLCKRLNHFIQICKVMERMLHCMKFFSYLHSRRYYFSPKKNYWKLSRDTDTSTDFFFSWWLARKKYLVQWRIKRKILQDHKEKSIRLTVTLCSMVFAYRNVAGS